MKLRSDGIRLCIVGLVLAVLVLATPVWGSAPPASQGEEVKDGEVFGFSFGSWLGSLWISLRAAAGVGGADIELDAHTLTEPEDENPHLTSEPFESTTTEEGVNIDPDG